MAMMPGPLHWLRGPNKLPRVISISHADADVPRITPASECDVAEGSNASVELAWRVGLTPDFGRIVATQRTDASGQSEVAPNKTLGT